ncbi:TPA: filamentous hemagglutinin N-terminal domain-containing protein [Klebsiella quasipneumoniae subsp. similipneumoniae]|nr:filamentous hemagglutinin N-terminal domain-containing protein [Klebsiella quasipneumoniae subsp. similipneumoniae]
MKIKLITLSIGLFTSIAAYASTIPAGGKVTFGDGSIQRPSRNEVLIQQNSDKMIIDWTSFNVAKGNSVTFKQPNANSIALNRVVGSASTNIVGKLNANGKVFLVNPNGIMLRSGSQINVSGIVATTKNIRNEDFINGNYLFTSKNGDMKSVVNQANIKTSDGGFVVLSSDNVINSGRITAPSGKIILAASEKIKLNLDKSGLKSIVVDGEIANAMIRNSGYISSTNGQIYLTALGKDMLMNTVINNHGIIAASGFTDSEANININGGKSGKVEIEGQLIANNFNGHGGNVIIDGESISLRDFASIDVQGSKNAGNVNIGSTNTSHINMSSFANIYASSTSTGNGGKVNMTANDSIKMHGLIESKGGIISGDGGYVEFNSKGDFLNNGTINVTAPNGYDGVVNTNNVVL